MPKMRASEILRTPTTHGTARVDRGAAVIHGAKVLELGDVNDSRPFTVDEESLRQMIVFGNEKPEGLKARFTHPSMSDDGLGKFLGRWKNFRREGVAVLADLHVSPTAFTSPHGDMGNYVLDLAEDDPEAFGVSAAGRLSDEMYDELNDEDRDPDQRVPIRWKRMMAADVVDEPAATRGGFFAVHQARSLDLHATATALIDQHLASMSPGEIRDRFTEFLKRWCQERGKEYQDDLAEDDDMPKTPPAPPETKPAAEQRDHSRYVETFGDQGARWFLDGKSYEDCLTESRQQLLEERDELRQRVADLEADLAEVKKTLGGQPLSSEEPGSPQDPRKHPLLSCVRIAGRVSVN